MNTDARLRTWTLAKIVSHEIRQLEQEDEAPARRAGAGSALVCRVPDDGEHAVVILSCGAAEIGVELLGPKRGVSKA